MCINLQRRDLGYITYWIPCGKCYQCIAKKKTDWQIRMKLAANMSDCSFFKLLSYNDEHLPDISDKLTQKNDVQKFLKRLRIHLNRFYNRHVDLKYFIASETGEQHDRLHYHCCFFISGIKISWLEFNEHCRKCWHYGDIGNAYPLNARAIGYATKYIQKSDNWKIFSKFSANKLLSPYSEHLKNVDFTNPDRLPSIPLNGKASLLPNYWCKQLYSEDELLLMRKTLQVVKDSTPEDRYKFLKQCNFENLK